MDAGKTASILLCGIPGGQAAGVRCIDALQLLMRLVNIGDAKPLACHPASTPHRQLNDPALAKAGVPRDMARLSMGIEHSDDIIADLAQALGASRGRAIRARPMPTAGARSASLDTPQ